MLEIKVTAHDGQERAVSAPGYRSDIGQAREIGSGLGFFDIRRRRPMQIPRIQIVGVLFQGQGHRSARFEGKAGYSVAKLAIEGSACQGSGPIANNLGHPYNEGGSLPTTANRTMGSFPSLV